jgi:hypothetical protein
MNRRWDGDQRQSIGPMSAGALTSLAAAVPRL